MSNLESKVAKYLAQEHDHNATPEGVEVLSKTTPYPEMAHDLVAMTQEEYEKHTLLPVVAGCLFAGRQILLHKKSESTDEGGTARNPELLGKWEMPGGMVKEGEGLAEALEREVKEELGLKVSVHQILDIKTWDSKSDGKRYLVMFFHCTPYNESRVCPPNCKWVTFDQLRRMRSSSFLPGELETILEIAKEYI